MMAVMTDVKTSESDEMVGQWVVAVAAVGDSRVAAVDNRSLCLGHYRAGSHVPSLVLMKHPLMVVSESDVLAAMSLLKP